MNFKFELNSLVNVQEGPQGVRVVARGWSESIGEMDRVPWYNLRVPTGDGCYSVWEHEITQSEQKT